MKNAVHGSSNVEKAVEVIKEFLPEVEVLPDGTVRGLKLVLFFFASLFFKGFYLLRRFLTLSLMYS